MTQIVIDQPLGQCLKQSIEHTLEQHLTNLNGQPQSNLYEMLMKEIEPAILSSILKHTKGNQSHAAACLGLNRGTLRKKLKTHNIIN